MSLPIRGLRFVTVDQHDALVEPLLAELAVEYATRYERTPQEMAGWLRDHPAGEFTAPDGGMLIGLLDDEPATGGAFRRFDEETAELKRIWTNSRHRRRGLARSLLAELEAEIVARGYRRIHLTTGSRQPEAEALYLATGYRRVDEGRAGRGEIHPIAFGKELGIVDRVPELRTAAGRPTHYFDGETVRQRLGLPEADDIHQKAVPR
jgi:GNAT superfamily N-acetyltransferase